MNINEAIEKIKSVAYNTGTFFKIMEVSLDKVIEIVEQIDTQPKVVVPEFIDSFIRYAKAEGMSLFIAMDNAQNKESEWIIKNEETFARAWLDGYEVEKEQLYTVEIPNPNIIGNEVSVLMMNGFRQIVIVKAFGDDWKHHKSYQLTESQIKKDFKWAWDVEFAKPVEVE